MLHSFLTIPTPDLIFYLVAYLVLETAYDLLVIIGHFKSVKAIRHGNTRKDSSKPKSQRPSVTQS